MVTPSRAAKLSSAALSGRARLPALKTTSRASGPAAESPVEPPRSAPLQPARPNAAAIVSAARQNRERPLESVERVRRFDMWVALKKSRERWRRDVPRGATSTHQAVPALRVRPLYRRAWRHGPALRLNAAGARPRGGTLGPVRLAKFGQTVHLVSCGEARPLRTLARRRSLIGARNLPAMAAGSQGGDTCSKFRMGNAGSASISASLIRARSS